jgi:hypothetical protein
MTTTEKTKSPVQRVLSLLADVRQGDKGWTALCPAHGDRRSSLSIAEGDNGTVLLKCFAGCETAEIVAALGLTTSDLFAGVGKAGRKPSIGPGLTLAQYADAKNLPLEFLRKMGLSDVYLQSGVAVRIPYLDMNGVVAATRMRVSMTEEPRFIWKTGSKPALYGLWRLVTRKSKYVCLVEGESDAHTLWLHRFPALGLPGATTWTEDWAGYLDGFERIYAVIEPDQGGETFLKRLSNSRIRDRVRLLTIPGAKDPSELYLADPDRFKRAWKNRMKEALQWQDAEEAERKGARRAAWKQCKDLARRTDILSDYAAELQERGLVGETRAAKILYLCMTSRVLPRPICGVPEGPSSGGKSYVVKRMLEFFPPTAYYELTAMSERALAYSTEPLSHRFIILYEAAALKGDFLKYLVRSLLSEGLVRYLTVEKTKDGQLQARLIEREGPTGLIMTTTAVSHHPENETRHFAIPIRDTRSQTKRILRAIASQYSSSRKTERSVTELERWRALQAWIGLANHNVVIPYAEAMAELIPPTAVRLRRDITAILNLVVAHAILHQATREVDDNDHIIATLADYRAVWELLNEIVSEGAEQTVSRTIRRTVEVVREVCSKTAPKGQFAQARDDGPVATMLVVAKALNLDRSSASRRVNQCLEKGYVKNLENGRGRPFRLVTGDPLPEEQGVMPTPEEVLREWERRQ